MSRILTEVEWFKSSNRFLSLILSILLTVSIVLSFVSLNLNSLIKDEFEIYNDKYSNSNFKKLGDNLENDVGYRFEASPDCSIKQLALYKTLKSSEYTYLEISSQISYKIENFKGDEKFLYGYENGILNSDSSANVQVKSMLFSDNVKDFFDLKIIEGSWFNKEDDFKLSAQSNDTPVILGYEYKEYYTLGDEIITGDGRRLKVIGFFDKGAVIQNGYGLTYLDRYLIVPSPNLTTEDINNSDFHSYMYGKFNGILVSDKSANELQDTLSNWLVELGIPPVYYIVSSTNAAMTIFNTSIDEILLFISVITVLIVVMTSSILLLVMTLYIKKNLRYFSILLISGFSYQDIKKIIMTIPISYCIKSFMVGFILNVIASIFLQARHYLSTYIIVTLGAIVICLVVGKCCVHILKKQDLSAWLRRK